MNARLPIAITIPHSGVSIPPELVDRVTLTPEQIFNEADVYTDQIYDFRERVLHWQVFPYARAILDVNRPQGAHPFISADDGFIKRKTSYGADVYAAGKAPDTTLEAHLINTYWRDWHSTLAGIAADNRVKLVLDCHSMAAVGPSHYGDPSQPRPRITASNCGKIDGTLRSADYPLTASPELTRIAGEKFGASLADVPELAPTTPAMLNTPFWMGYTIHLHGGKTQPWLMIELSRALYIGEQTGDSPIVPPDATRIALLRERIWEAIQAIVETMN